jgi:hypothetical protein
VLRSKFRSSLLLAKKTGDSIMKTKLWILYTVATLLLVSCFPALPSSPTPNIPFIKTSAAQTVIANFTLTAGSSVSTPASTATSEPVNTSTALATFTSAPAVPTTPVPTQIGKPGATQVLLCDKYSWDDTTVDVNIPDNTQMTPGQSFVKTWLITNSGTCTWGAGYKIVYGGYNTPMSGQPEPLPLPVAPGQSVQISVQFIAPTQLSSYVSAWTLQNANGEHFFGSNIQGTAKAKPLFVKIVVK